MLQRVGPYEVLGELGRGAFGAVVRGRDPTTGDEVAIKLLLPGRAASALARERFAREARALERLQHPGIVAVRASGEAQGVPFIVMDLVQGESLEDRLVRGPLDEGLAVRIGAAVARALSHAHAAQVLHRDVKPSNVLLERDGTPRLTDFGLAKELDARQSLTQSGATLGTPGFCAPEQALSERGGVGPAADVYGLGATLYAALTGAPPITGSNALEVMVATRSRPPAAPSSLRPGLDPALEAIVLRCLAKDPADRPASADALALELDAWLRSTSPRARQRRERGRRARLTLIAGAGGALAACTAALVVGRHLLGAADEASASTASSGSSTRSSPSPLAKGTPGVSGSPDATASADPAPAPLPAASPSPDAKAALAAAHAAEAAGALDDAARGYARALDLEPRLVEAAFALASVRIARGDLKGARAAYDQVIAAVPGEARAWAGRAKVRQGLGDGAGGLEDAEHASALDPLDPFVDDVLGSCRSLMGDGRGALEALDRAVERAPRYATARVNRAQVRMVQGDLVGAQSDATLAVALIPGDARAWLSLGTVDYARGDLVLAEVHHTLAAGMPGPIQALALACRGACRLEREDHDGGLDDAERALSLDPASPLAFAVRSLERTRRSDRPGALADAARAVELAPGIALGHVAQGEVQRAGGDTAGALESFDRAVAVDARCALAYLCRGALRQLLDQPGAEEDLTRAIELHPRLGLAYITRARVRATRDVAGARADLDLAAALLPDFAAPFASRGLLRDRAGDAPGAIEDYERAVAKGRDDPAKGRDDPALRVRVAVLLIEADQPARARPHLDAALRLDPTNGHALAERGRVLRALGELDASLADLRRAVELLPDAASDEGRHAREELGQTEAALRR